MKNIAVIGATGLVGEKLLQIFQKVHMNANYSFFASQRSANQKLTFLNRQYTVQHLNQICHQKIDYALFVSTNEVSQKFVPILLSEGATVIDNSSVFRLHDDVPLVVPEINGHNVAKSKLLANPNCTTIELAIVLNCLKKLGLKRVVASTYQAVSGAGKDALHDLQTKASYGSLLGNLPHPIFDNFIPQIDEFLPDGYTKEEMKVINECRKILQLPSLAICCTAVRVPVSVCHGISANIEFENPFELNDVKRLLQQSKNIVVADDNEHKIYPMPILAKDTPSVYVGRLLLDKSQKNTLNCFLVADNLMRGAAYNAFEILVKKMECDNV